MSKKVLIIVAAGALFVIIIATGAGFYLLWNKVSSLNTALESMNKDEAEEDVAEEDEAEDEDDISKIGPKYPLETMIVNLSDPGGNRYLRVTMELELNEPVLEGELNLRVPQIKDSLLMIISTKAIKEINSAEGKNNLRSEIITNLNNLLKSGSITNIYFTEFVIQ